MVRRPNQGVIVDPSGNPISVAAANTRVSVMGVKNFIGGFPDADPNSTFGPYQRRGSGGSVTGKYQEMLQTHAGIASAAYWAITEASALPKEIVWPHASTPGAEEKTFMFLCQKAAIDEAVVFDGALEGAAALWQYPILDAFIGFGLMMPRLLDGGGVEWYPVAHSSVMLWDPEPGTYFMRGVKFSTGQGYANVNASDLVHVIHGTATAGEWEGRSILRSLLQPYELWKQTALNAGIYNQMSWGFLDIAYDPSVSTDDVEAMNLLAGQFQDGVRKYILRPRAVDVEMKYPKGSGPDVIAQLTYYDTIIQRMLNDNLAGIGKFGSRAMAETVDDAAGRRAKAWIDGIFERTSRGMFGWLAKQVGYEGKLPVLRSVSAEMTTGLDGWAAYVQGVQSGLIRRGPDDEAWARRVIGAPEVTVDQANDNLPEAIGSTAVGIAQTILAGLVPGAPVPIAPAAAKLLLIAAGVQPETAEEMVMAQMAVAESAVSAKNAQTAPSEVPVAAEPAITEQPVAPETAPSDVPTVTIGGNVEVPASIGESSAFAPASAEPPDDRLADGVDLEPTTGMAEAAARALEWRAEHGRGGTAVGVARARDIKNKKNLSEETVRRMASYFARHAVDKKASGFNDGEEGFPSAGRIAWDLWGGDAGAGWAERKVAELDRLADDLTDEATVLVASMAEVPDSIVPDDVMAAAKAAIEAHRAIAKGRTTDAEALLIARDLASGKRLAWERVMRLAEYFGREYPRQVETKSFKSNGPSRHAYELRGGDAGRRWVKSLLTAYALGAHRRAARLSDPSKVATGDLADGEGEGVVVVGADGKEFTTYRELRPEEKLVAWVSLAEARSALDLVLAAVIQVIAAQHREETIAALADGWQPGERDRVWNKYMMLYATALTDSALELRKQTEAEVVAEGMRAERSGVTGPAKSAAQVDEAVASFQAAADKQFALAAAATQKSAEIVADRVQGEVEQAVLAGTDMATWTSRITPAGLMTSVLQPRNMVESASRAAGYAQMPAALAQAGQVPLVPDRVIRTSIPDADRCEVCEKLDGETYEVRDFVVGNDLKLPPLPDPNCLGGAGRCRCGYIGLYD
jgi:hypothetical protein